MLLVRFLIVSIGTADVLMGDNPIYKKQIKSLILL